MSTFRPVQVPQQPRTFFTPGTQSASPIPGTFQQGAAYFRQGSEVIQPQRFAPIIAAPSFVPNRQLQIPRERDRGMQLEIEETLPFATTGTAAGVPPPRTADQSAAYRRDVPMAQQQPTLTPPAAAQRVAFVQLQLPVAAARNETAILEEVLPLSTNGTAAGVPPPRSMDQSAAYRRDPPAPAQSMPQMLPSAPIGVPPTRLDLPQASSRADTAVLEEVLPLATGGTASAVPPPRTVDQAAAYRREAPALMQLQIFSTFGIQGAVPAASLQIPAALTYRMEAMFLAVRPLSTPSPAPLFVPSVRPSIPVAGSAEIPQQLRTFAPISTPQAFVPAGRIARADRVDRFEIQLPRLGVAPFFALPPATEFPVRGVFYAHMDRLRFMARADDSYFHANSNRQRFASDADDIYFVTVPRKFDA